MLVKYLPLLIFISLINSECILASTLKDVLEAFEDLKHFVDVESHYTISDIVWNQTQAGQLELYNEKMASLTEINNQKESILSKIDDLANNAEEMGLNVDDCVTIAKTDLENYAADIEHRLYDECSSFYELYGRNIWPKFNYLAQSAVLCANMSIVQCNNEHENATTCFDFVLDKMQKLKNRVKERIEATQLEARNEGPRLKLPCKQMITELMTLYPSLILNSVSSCIDYASARASLNPICGDP